MTKYILTDGYTISENGSQVFDLMKSCDSNFLFVNGLEFTTNNAPFICNHINKKSPTNLIEVGLVFGEVKLKMAEDAAFDYISSENNKEDESVLQIALNQDIKNEIKDFCSNNIFPFKIDFVNCNTKKVEKKRETASIQELNEEIINENKIDSKPVSSVFRTFEEEKPRKKRAITKIEVKEDVQCDNTDVVDDDSILGGSEENIIVSDNKNTIKYPTTVEELKAFPLRKEGGKRLTKEGKIAILKFRDLGYTELSKLLDIPLSTVNLLINNFKKRTLDFTDAEYEEAEERALKSNIDSFQEENTSLRSSSLETENELDEALFKELGVPAGMIRNMKYNPYAEGIEKITINGNHLTGNIIFDSERALGYVLSNEDKKVLMNAYFCLNVYEEDFLKNLKCGNFSHMDDVNKLRPVCEAFNKIRRAMARKREKER